MSRKNVTILVLMLVLGSILAGIPPTQEYSSAAAYELATSTVESGQPTAAPMSVMLASWTRPLSSGSAFSGR